MTDTLKPGWTMVKFGEVVKQVKDKVDARSSGLERYIAGEHMDTDDLRIRRWGEVSDDYLGPAFHMRFKPGHVLYGSRRTYLRKVAVADFEGICANTTFVLEPQDPAALLPELLPFIMQTEAFHEYSIENSKGSVNPYINFSDLAQYEFALPPLAEQRRMAALLTSVSKNMEGHYQLSSTARQVAQAFVDSIFDLSIIKPFLMRELSAKSLGLIPLGRLCSIQVGYPFKSSAYVDNGDRLLRCSNVGVDETDWSPDRTTYWPTEQRDEYEEYILNSGDIVIAMDRPFVGDGFKVAKISGSDLPALLLQRVGRFMLGSDLDSDFLWCFLHSSSFMLQLLSQQQGTDLPHISKFDIERATVPVFPIERQKEIGQYYRRLIDGTKRTDRRFITLQSLRANILTEALGT